MMQLLKDMKKIKEDAKTVEMAHPSGHSLTIILKKVPAIQREALKRLPLHDGGDVKGVHKSYFDEPETKKQMGESKAGDKVRSMDINKKSKDEAKEEHHKVLGELKSMPPPKIKGLADGGEVENSKDEKPPVVVNVGQPNPAAQQANAPIEVQKPNVPTANPNVLLPNGSMSAPGAAQTGQQAIQSQQSIDAAKANAMVPIEQARLRAAQLNAQQDQDRYNALSTHADQLATNLKNIDPKAYVNNMSAPQKVSTAIGLFLGNFSVPFGGSNFTQDYLNKSIDRDIAAQISNQDKQKTIFGAYKDLYNQGNAASAMTKASMAQIYSDQVDQIATQLGTPQSVANAQKLKAALAVIQNKGIMDASGNLANTQNNPAKNAVTEQEPSQSSNPNQKLIDQGIVAGNRSHGMSGAEANVPKEEQKTPESEYNNILTPDAESKLNNLQYGPPKAREDYPKALEQYTHAQQVQKQVGQINDLFPKLRSEATLSGNIRSHINPHAAGAAAAIPGAIIGGGGAGALTGGTMALPGAAAGAGIGAGIGEGAAHVARGALEATGGQKEVQYQTDKAGLAKFLIGALGNQATGQEIDDIVNTNTPGYWDNDNTYKKKLDNIKKFLINRTETSLIDRYGLTTK